MNSQRSFFILLHTTSLLKMYLIYSLYISFNITTSNTPITLIIHHFISIYNLSVFGGNAQIIKWFTETESK
jgi:hypothetical protein